MAYAYPPQNIDLISGCACAIIFILFLALDAWKAIKRKAYWFPGAFLVISALTLQFLNFVDYSPVSITPEIDDIKYEDVDNVLKVQLVIDSGRLVMCVFIAYLLPGLASSGFRSVWADLGGVTISALSHMFYEIYLVIYWSDWLPISVTAWFEVFSGMVFIALILLVLLSVSAVLAGKTIHIMMNEKVSSLVECCSSSPKGCGSIGHHVLKCWIIVRCSQPEDVVARSVLSSLAGLLVAVCIVVFGFKWESFYIDNYKTLSPLNKTTLVLQFIFVLIGWILVSVRWLRAVIYFPIDERSVFHVEDFWTRCINDLKYGQLKGPLFRGMRYRNRTVLENNIMDLIIQFRLYSLSLSIASSVQKIIVFFSKVSCFFSWIMLWPFLMIHKKIMSLCGPDSEESKFSDYRNILRKIKMPGEIAENIWIANELGFKSTEKHMKEGKRSTTAMIEIIGHRTEPAADGGKEEQVEKYFKYIGKKSWKMEAVSLIHLMLSMYDGTSLGVVDEAMEACCEAWPLMDFVETSDTEVNLLSLAADKDFQSLDNIWKKMRSAKSDMVRTILRDRMQKDMELRISKGKSQARWDDMDDSDSMDWLMAAANFNLNKISRKVGYRSVDTIDNSRDLLANVIVDCWAEARNNAIIEKCNKWAVNGKEEEIYHAAFIAGKAMSGPETLQTSQRNNAVNPALTAGHDNDATGEETVKDGGENDPGYVEQIVDAVHDFGESIVDVAEIDGDNN